MESIMKNTKEQIIDLLKNDESGVVKGIEIHENELEIYFQGEVPEKINDIEYDHIAQYIIDANK
jgi:predicted YcjX-like family ATPase